MKSFRWAVLGLLFLASVINYIDRQSLSILASTIQENLGISDIGYSTVVQMFLFAYMLSFLVAGWITDRLGVRASMALFIGWWSIANCLTGFVGSLRGLAATRFLLGAGESGLYVVAPKVVSQLFPASQRGLAVGIYSTGATIGATIAPPLIAWLSLAYGWRAVFIAGGILGLVWIIPWLLLYRTATAQQAHQPISAPLPARAQDSIRWWEVLLCREVVLLVLLRAITDPVWQFILFWLPKYMMDVHQLSLEQMGQVGWVPYLAADVGGIVGGFASGLLIYRGFEAPDARKWLMTLCAVVIPCGVLLVPRLGSSGSIISVMAVVAFAEFAWMVTATALAVDVLPTERFGRMYGVIAAGSGLGGMLFMNLVGQLVTRFSYTPVFVIMGCLHPISLILVWWIASGYRRRKAEEAAAQPQPDATAPLAAAGAMNEA